VQEQTSPEYFRMSLSDPKAAVARIEKRRAFFVTLEERLYWVSTY
jgi:hypothetical protein